MIYISQIIMPYTFKLKQWYMSIISKKLEEKNYTHHSPFSSVEAETVQYSL